MLLPASQAAAAPNSMPAADRRAASRQDHPEDVGALRPQREAYADFLGAAGYGEGEQAVNADGSEQECDQGEGGERAHLHGARFGFGFDDIAEHTHVGDRQVGVGAGDDAGARQAQSPPRGVEMRRTRSFGTYQMMLSSGTWLVGDVDLRFAFSFRAAGADFAHHAHDGAVGQGEFEVTPQRIFARPVAAREGLADHGGERRFASIGFADIAAQAQRNAERGEVIGRDVAQHGVLSSALRVARRGS